MMIFEYLWLIAARISYWLIRPFTWLICGRGCSRCKHYYNKNRYSECQKTIPEHIHCITRPWLPHFERYKRAKKRKFFDI